MASKKPGIAKRAPRSSKVAPIKAPAPTVNSIELQRAWAKVLEPRPRIRQKLANWLESTIIRWLRRA